MTTLGVQEALFALCNGLHPIHIGEGTPFRRVLLPPVKECQTMGDGSLMDWFPSPTPAFVVVWLMVVEQIKGMMVRISYSERYEDFNKLEW
ncbi:hypothetical protein NPIL_538061 [Nephila pilipes]|uniref:Uncharacterized protein n=1 Tax=Nephila pilipes TaxID=299642 RepID=A0A8X6MWS3_NEPPI|nr:hypothetical protein NPIL_538061 [Nephila pilipes]